MTLRVLILLIVLASLVGCASLDRRDFAELGAEFALNLAAEILTDGEHNSSSGHAAYNDSDDDYIRVWDKEESARRLDERERKEISDMLDALTQDHDYVLLPTGELYPVNAESKQD